MKSYKINKLKINNYKFPIGYQYYYYDVRFGIHQVVDYITLQNIDYICYMFGFFDDTKMCIKSLLIEKNNVYLAYTEEESRYGWDTEDGITRAKEYK